MARTEVQRALFPIFALTTTLFLGCVAALKKPPALATIGKHSPPIATPTPTDRVHLLEQAEAAFALRPNVASVITARQFFLAAAQADETKVDGLLGASRANAWLVEHETSRNRRAELATEGVQTCQWCIQRAPEQIECDYRLALALGQQARERPATASDALPRITALLEKVIAKAPMLDEAGGHRVLALVLLRAPGWPLGPGDPELALEHAHQAMQLAPVYPPNLLVLAEALHTNGKQEEALLTYQQAEHLAKERFAAGDRNAREWIDQASHALPKTP